MRRRRSSVLLASLVAAVGLAVVPHAADAAPTGGDQSGAAAAAGRAGDVVAETPFTAFLLGASADKLTYLSTGINGERTTVTGTLLTPILPWTGPGTRPLVSYAVGTQGMADRCAPSTQFAGGGLEYESAFVQTLLTRGYSVVVTDYQGLGTPGVHPYANGPVLGRNVLDAARAAKRAPQHAAPADAPVLIAGYSEGGGAAAGALEQHKTYAPDVKVIGGYAGAVPADLAKVAPGLDGSAYATFLIYAVDGLNDGYPALRISDLLNPAGKAALAAGENSCLVDGLPQGAFKQTKDYTVDGRPLAAYLTRPDIAATLESIRLGKTAPDVPVLVAHSTADDVVPFEQDRDMARSWCAKGGNVRFAPGVLPTHVGQLPEASAKAYTFLDSLVGGTPSPSMCGTF